MRFVWAVVAFVLAAVLIGAGIAQRTIFVGPSSEEARVDIEEPAPFVLLDGDVLRINAGAQKLLIRGEGEIFTSYGRTADMEAWLSDSEYNHVTVGDEDELVVEHVAAADDEGSAETPAPETTATPAPEEDAEAPAGRNPAGSDLWLDSFSEENFLATDKMQLPEGTSVLIAYDGTRTRRTTSWSPGRWTRGRRWRARSWRQAGWCSSWAWSCTCSRSVTSAVAAARAGRGPGRFPRRSRSTWRPFRRPSARPWRPRTASRRRHRRGRTTWRTRRSSTRRSRTGRARCALSARGVVGACSPSPPSV